MISASKYQQIIYFMPLLKDPLCINRAKQRLLCMDTHRGCRSKRLPTPWKKKNFLFFSLYEGPFCYILSMGRALCYVFLLMRGFFHRMEGFLLLFIYAGGPFCYVFLLVWGLFHYFFLHVGGLFCLRGGFYVFMVFLWACPFPL